MITVSQVLHPDAACCTVRPSLGLLSTQALVSQVKAQLARASNIPANLQRLVFRGRVLKDEQRLTTYSAPPIPASVCSVGDRPMRLLKALQRLISGLPAIVAGRSSSAAPHVAHAG